MVFFTCNACGESVKKVQWKSTLLFAETSNVFPASTAAKTSGAMTIKTT